MSSYYEWFKALHIIAIIAWMCGLLYLPRLFVYHADATIGSEFDLKLKIMEKRLLRWIMNPAMIVSLIFGLLIADIYGFYNLGKWFHIKMTCVLLMTIFHGCLARWRKKFEQGNNTHSARFYRIANEIPTLLLILIVILVVVKPFES